MAGEGSADGSGLQQWEKGGANDPTVVFGGLNNKLIECKEEFSPYGWRASISEFNEKMDAERRLRALNALPGSGSEVNDGVVQGTPVWQERLDKMMLVEHLKKKLMISHTRMTEGNDLLLRSHAWLVKNPLLADTFSHCIRNIPPSQFDRVDILQIKLEEKRRLLKEAREHHEDHLITITRQRDAFQKKMEKHYKRSGDMELLHDTCLEWSLCVLRNKLKVQNLKNASFEARNTKLEVSFAGSLEDLEEQRRQFELAMKTITEDRDKFRKLYQRMVEAHEKAKRDLEATKGTAEGMKQMIMVLSQEKTQLEHKVEDLEEDKRRMAKEMAVLRDLVAKLREEIRRNCDLMKGTEVAMIKIRDEVTELTGNNAELEDRMDRAAETEVRLRDDFDVMQREWKASRLKEEDLFKDVEAARSLLPPVEFERDRALELVRFTEADLIRTLEQATEQLWCTREKARRDLEHFKTTELARAKEDFRRKTDAILRRNVLLEKEVAIGDEVAPHLSVLNPLHVDETKMCAICRRLIVYEGTVDL